MGLKKSIYIYGAGNRGSELLSLIQEFYDDKIIVEGFVDMKKKGQKGNLPIYDIHSISYDSTIVISVFDFEIALQIALDIKKSGYQNLFWYSVNYIRKERCDFFVEQCVDCNGWSEETLLHIEMHAMNACNLNCVGCTHFSPILAKKKPDTERQLKTIELLQKKIPSIVRFCILGGEPFLNTDLQLYINKVKQLYPTSSVYIVTNGLLLPKVSEDLLEYIGEQNVCISISKYEPTSCIIDDIIEVLNKYNIIYNIREERELFNKPLSLRPVEDSYCISNGCITICNEKIARCPTLMYIEDLNKKFVLEFPSEGIINLETDISGRELKELLRENVPLCKYCIKNEIKWSTCGKEVKVEDFVKIDD